MYEVTCPTCQKTRTVSKVQLWRLSKGLRKRCKSCSVRGRKYPNRKNPGNDGAAIAARMKGNKLAVGIQYTEAELKRRVEVMKGNKFAANIRGEAHHSWKGGTYGTERHRAMGQSEYKVWRIAVFERDNYTCQDCSKNNIYLHADHVIGWAENDSLRYDIGNGLTLCYKCHYKKTFGKLNEEKALLWGVPAKYRKVIR